MQFGFSPLSNLLLQCPLHPHSFREIPRDFSETDQLAGIISNGRDDHICPKPGTIFTQTPAFVFESPFFCGDLQLPCWLAISQIFFWVEAREVFAYNFRTVIPLDTFCPLIPAPDVAVAVQHENCIILDPLYDQSEPVLAFLQCQFALQNLSPLLKLSNSAKSLLGAAQPQIALAGNHLECCAHIFRNGSMCLSFLKPVIG